MVGFYVIILQQHKRANAPDLRDRFIVGTGSSYNLNATGGSANAVLIAHNHSITANGSNTDQNDYFGGSTANYGINANGIGNITYTSTIKTKGQTNTGAMINLTNRNQRKPPTILCSCLHYEDLTPSSRCPIIYG